MISKNPQFIFIHVAKCAGTSLNTALSKIGAKPTGHKHILSFSQAKIEDYYTFAFVRNPWDRAVSRFFYRQKKAIKNPKSDRLKVYLNGTFEESLLNPEKYTINQRAKCKHLKNLNKLYGSHENCIDWISNDSGKIIVDFVGRFENLEEDFLKVQSVLGISCSLSHQNSSPRSKNYTEYYTEETKDIISNLYSRDIAAFGYKFGE